jgi:hypothetical protein
MSLSGSGGPVPGQSLRLAASSTQAVTQRPRRACGRISDYSVLPSRGRWPPAKAGSEELDLKFFKFTQAQAASETRNSLAGLKRRAH